MTPEKLQALEDLAAVVRDKFEEGTFSPEGFTLLAAAISRVYPEDVHVRETCPVHECRPGREHSGCDECPSQADILGIQARLDTWLVAYRAKEAAAS